MRNIFLTLLLGLVAACAAAQNTCPTPSQSVVVFFGNGINTTQKSAKESLAKLREQLGDTYNGQKIRYDIAYNKTNGLAADFGQAALQAAIQWDSQVMGWFNGLGLAPDWFNQWYQKYLLAFTTVVAEELPEHVEKYNTALLFGQKVLVVAHSQGNFYVNEAKKLMQQQLPADKMQGFAVFGVAVPSNNVAGATGPYYTNHRDFIYTIPTALPSNWTLHRSGGALAQDINPVQAHFFTETYMSSDFDILPVLVAGIKAQLGMAKQPTADCTSYYRPQILAMVAGSYDTSCKNTPGATLTISTKGVTTADGRFVDMNGPDTLVNLGRSESYTTLVNGLSWNNKGILAGCGGDTAPSLSPINITSTMMGLIQSEHRLFPANRCWVRNGGVSKPLTSATPVVISGTTVHLGNLSWDFGGDLQSESVKATQGNETLPSDYDPGFILGGSNQNGINTLLMHRRMKGLQSVSVLDTNQPVTNQIVMSCSLL